MKVPERMWVPGRMWDYCLCLCGTKPLILRSRMWVPGKKD